MIGPDQAPRYWPDVGVTHRRGLEGDFQYHGTPSKSSPIFASLSGSCLWQRFAPHVGQLRLNVLSADSFHWYPQAAQMATYSCNSSVIWVSRFYGAADQVDRDDDHDCCDCDVVDDHHGCVFLASSLRAVVAMW
jgi:hypothetical protein